MDLDKKEYLIRADVKEARYTCSDLVKMDSRNFKYFVSCLEVEAFRLLGISYKKFVELYRTIEGDIVIRYL